MAILDRLLDIVRAESAAEVPERVAAIGQAARLRHGDGVSAVLAYGSALRERDDASKMVDLYLLVDGYAEARQGRWLSLANRLLPPNVYYIEIDVAGTRVRSKYAMVGLGQLERLVEPRTLHPYFWARFAQPTALVWVRPSPSASTARWPAPS
jgi:predicted nucleotidyltransferase